MISPLSYAFISFINFFMIPVVSLRIYSKRHNLECKNSFDFLHEYIIMCIFNLPVGKVLASLVEKAANTSIHAETTKYTLVALAGAILIPYMMELIEKGIHVDVEIKSVREVKENENENQN